MIRSILIANRGEIAVRVIRTCKEMGIRTVAVHSTADASSLHVKMADSSVCIGPPPSKDSYLNVPNLIAAAVLSKADAVHPGVGFLSESASFAQEVRSAGLEFIGPDPEVIELLGDKIRAKDTADGLSIPVIPGSDGPVSDGEAAGAAEAIGYPLIIKAAAGGGGRGMRIVYSPEDLARSLETARAEALASFSDGRLYLERYLSGARHVEVQLLADTKGSVVHLGERDCTVQKRHQKLIEESPSPAIDRETRERIYADAIELFKSLKYVGAGTVEFLVKDGKHYFMEVNARIQVEHPVSEMRSGMDIVAEQIRAASGLTCSKAQKDIILYGHVIECRLNALGPGRVEGLVLPGGPGTRVDTHLFYGCEVPQYYDALIVKLIVQADDRPAAIARMRRALNEVVITGLPTNLEIQQKLFASAVFNGGDYGTGLYDDVVAGAG